MHERTAKDAAWGLFFVAVCVGIAAATLELIETHDRHARNDTQNFLPALLMAISKAFSVIHATHSAELDRFAWTLYAPAAAIFISQVLWSASAVYALHFDDDDGAAYWVCAAALTLLAVSSLSYCVYVFVRRQANRTVATICYSISVALGLAAAVADLEDVRSRFRSTEKQEFVTNLLMGVYDGFRIPNIIVNDAQTLYKVTSVVIALVSTVMWFVSAGEAIRLAEVSNHYAPPLTSTLGPAVTVFLIAVFWFHDTRASTNEDENARDNKSRAMLTLRPLNADML